MAALTLALVATQMPVGVFPMLAGLVPSIANAAEELDQSATPGAGAPDLTGGDNEDILGQTVTAGIRGRLTKVRLPIGCPTPTDLLTLEIRTVLESGMPSDTVLASQTYSIGNDVTFKDLVLSARLTFNAGDRFAIVARQLGGSDTQKCSWKPADDNTTYPGGTGAAKLYPGAWDNRSYDYGFETYVDPIDVTGSTGFTVNSTNDATDGTCDSTHCSLREAIIAANARLGADTIRFNIAGPNPHTIGVGGTGLAGLPAVTDLATIDGTTQPGFDGSPVIELNGIAAGAGAPGLFVSAAGSTIRGLVINRFGGDGIRIQDAGGIRIEGNYIGTNVAGTAALGNAGRGVLIVGTANNVVGGSTAAAGNVISGNGMSGVDFSGGTGNTVSGNYIGTNAAGVAAIPNGFFGVLIHDGDGNTVGPNNLISGNVGEGVSIQGTATGNAVVGNLIGTNAAGTAAVPNSQGVELVASGANTIGGTSPEERNVISGNSPGSGVALGLTTASQVLGNYIGTNASGSAALGNGRYGVFINGGSANTIGAGNTISGNGAAGVAIFASPTQPASGNVIRGNRIGTNAAGTAAIPNAHQGVTVQGAADTTVGGLNEGEPNVISGNGQTGISFIKVNPSNPAPSGEIVGNYIGLGADGSTDIGNAATGIAVGMATDGEPIATSLSILGNSIGHNGGNGIWLVSVQGGLIQGNNIGSVGETSAPNSGSGITLTNSELVQVAQNVIRHSDPAGIRIVNSNDNVITDNDIRLNEHAGVQVEASSQRNEIRVGIGAITNNGGRGIELEPEANGGIQPPTVLFVSTGDGLFVSGDGTPGHTIDIHADPNGEGAFFLGSTVVDETGAWRKSSWDAIDESFFIAQIDAGSLRVTATETTASANASTSEFSAPFAAGATITFTPAVVPPGGELEVTVTGIPGSSVASIELVDPSGETRVALLGEMSGSTGTATFVVDDVPAGTYKVRATGGGVVALSTATLLVVQDYANHLWLTPKSVLSADVALTGTVQQHIWQQGQNAWFVVENVPADATIVVELTGPDAADYNVNLYADIFATYAALSAPQDPQARLAQFAPENFSPENFSPENFSPENFSPENFSPENFSPENFSPENFSPDCSTPPCLNADTYTGAQRWAFITFSARAGTSTERIVKNTWLRPGNFFIRVRGRDGGFTLTSPFELKVTVTIGSCAPSVGPISSGVAGIAPTVAPASPSGRKTLVLTDLARLAGTETEKAGLNTQLATFVSQEAGSIVDLSQPQYARVAAARDQVIANPRCPYAMNVFAEEVDRVVDAYRDLTVAPGGAKVHSIESVVIIGNDQIVPFFRYPDTSELAQATEDNYVVPVKDETISQAALKLNYILGQDEYGTKEHVSRGAYIVPLADLPVGRLVETAGEAAGMLAAYLQGTNLSTSGSLVPTSALVTGYDFLADGAHAVEAELEIGMGPAGAPKAADLLIQEQFIDGVPQKPSDPSAWKAEDLATKLLGSRHDITFLAGHFSAVGALAADFVTRLASSEVVDSTVDLRNAIIFSAGCHSGYSVVDGDAIDGVTGQPDWAQAFNRKGATFIGGTGYQYGDTDFILYGERLYLDFAKQLRTGQGAISVGRALFAAKREYVGARGIDEKTRLQATLFGLPMLKVDMPGPRYPSQPSIAPTSSPFDVTITPALSTHTVTLKDRTNPASPVDVTATYLAGSGAEQLVAGEPGQPILPLELRNVTREGSLLRSVGFRGGTYVDTPGITPLTSAPATELSNTRSAFGSTYFTPIRIWRVDYLGPANTRLAVTPAQLITSPPGSDTAILRAYSSTQFRFCYDDTAPTLALGAVIEDVSDTTEANAVNFSVRLGREPSQAWITYTATTGPFHGTWASLDLVQSATDPTLWTGTLPLGAQVAGNVRYMVQAFSPECLHSLDTNLGAYYTVGAGSATPPTPQATTIVFASGLPSSGRYGDTVSPSADLKRSDGTALVGEKVTFRLGSRSRSVTTDAAGRANATLLLSDVPGSYELIASFGGTDAYSPRSAHTPFTILTQPTAVSLTPATASGQYSDELTTRVVATLRDGESRPIKDQTLVFVVSGAGGAVDSAAAITNYLGQAELFFQDLSVPAGAYTIRAHFLGANIALGGGRVVTLTSDTYESATSNTSTLAVTAENATVAYTGERSTASGAALALSATVTPASDGLPGDLSLASVRYVLKSGATVKADITAPYGSGNWSAIVPAGLAPGTYTLEVTVVGGFYTSPTVSVPIAMGRIVFASTRDGNSEIYAMNADGTGVTRLTNNSAGDSDPKLSPDGAKIAFTSTRNGNMEIYVMNADGTGVARLTNHPAVDTLADWSPDGQRLAFTTTRHGNAEIYTMRATDGGALARLTTNSVTDGDPNYSPDGSRIAFTSSRDGNLEIYVMNADGSGPVTRLTTNPASDTLGDWSPDGTKIVFMTTRHTNAEIYVMNADGTSQTRLTTNSATDMTPDWSSDSKLITFSSNRDGNFEIYVMNPDGTGQIRRTNHSANDTLPNMR